MSMNTLVVSLVTFNGAAHVQHCLNSLKRQTLRDFALVVFDNASTDSTIDIVREWAPHARIIQSKKNVGFGVGHNEVIRHTLSKYVCVLNQDCALEPDYLQVCVDFLNGDAHTGSVTGGLLTVQSLTDRPHHGTVDTLGLEMSLPMHVSNLGAGTNSRSWSHSLQVRGVPATAALYRRSALDDISLTMNGIREYFDEDFFMYKEDIDLALRLELRGWKSCGLPQARGYHIRTTKNSLFSRESQNINRWSYRNHFYILIKDLRSRIWLKQGAAIFFYECIKFLYLLLFETKTLGALRDVWNMKEKMLAKRTMIMNNLTSHL